MTDSQIESELGVRFLILFRQIGVGATDWGPEAALSGVGRGSGCLRAHVSRRVGPRSTVQPARHALGDLQFGGQRQKPSVPTGADQILRGNLSDGYNDMFSGAGSAATWKHSHDGWLLFSANRRLAVPLSWKKSQSPSGSSAYSNPNLRQALCIIRGCLISSSIEPAYIPLVRPLSYQF